MDRLSCIFPYSVWECWWLAPLAFTIDLCFGDPKLLWNHPVCLLGRVLNALESPARSLLHAQTQGQIYGLGAPCCLTNRLPGCFCLLALVLCAALSVRAALAPPFLGTLAAVYFSWSGLALGSLLDAGRETLACVETDAGQQAREALSRLVSRDVSGMDSTLLRKTLADTLSENFTDAFLAPYFWLLVTGPVGLWCYKAVSTGDSMWGYLTERWRCLGWAFARCDDALAYIPARFSVVVLWLTDKI
ncbi:MAG: cobalamin biosynthesis protein CbiB, partial [Candidatus Desulfovibrio kirbyi]